MMTKLKPAIVLTAICIIVALLLSCVHLVTMPEILKNAKERTAKELRNVLPQGTSFDEIDLTQYADKIDTKVVIGAWKAPEGFVFKTSTKGYGEGLILLTGIDLQGKIVNTKCLESKETYGAENKLNGKYNGTDLSSLETIQPTGATAPLTAQGYRDGVEAALRAFLVVGERRSPEQVFKDNCNLALGTTDKTFTKWFVTEALTGIDAVYETGTAADGVVMLVGDKLIGVNSDGAVLSVINGSEDNATSEVTAEDKASVEAAYAIYSASTLTKVERPEGAKSSVKEIYATASGNLVFVMRSVRSYSADHGHYGDPLPIDFKVCISADGKILDVLTTSHGESKAYGDACATEAFYDSFRGASREEIVVLFPNLNDFKDGQDEIPAGTTGPGIIASATYTTTCYQNAVLDAFAAFELLNTENKEDNNE